LKKSRENNASSAAMPDGRRFQDAPRGSLEELDQ
jgi:hypothetical protein